MSVIVNNVCIDCGSVVYLPTNIFPVSPGMKVHVKNNENDSWVIANFVCMKDDEYIVYDDDNNMAIYKYIRK